MNLTISKPLQCWYCPPPNPLSIDYISLLRDDESNKVWCGTCLRFLGYDIKAPQIGGLIKSLALDCEMHVYRKPSKNEPVRASGQDVYMTAIDVIDRAYDRFNMEIQWYELQDPEHVLCAVKEGKPLSEDFVDMLPEPVQPALRQFLKAGFYLTRTNTAEKKKVLRLEHRYRMLDPTQPKCLVARAEVKWPDDLLYPPPEPVKQVIPKAAAKAIFLKAAHDVGVPTPEQFPKKTSDPQKLTAAIQAVLDATTKSLRNYLPDGEPPSLVEMNEWGAEIMQAAGWKVVVALNGLSFTTGYPDSQSC